MSNLTYDQQEKLKSTRALDREVSHYFDEKNGDAAKFNQQVGVWLKSINRAGYWAGAAK